MSKRRPPRVPPTKGKHPDYHLEIATGGRPAEALLEAISRLPHKPGLVYLAVRHDDDCPCLGGDLSMDHCTCEIVQLRAKHCDSTEEYIAQMRADPT